MVAPSSSRYGAKSDRRPNLASSAGSFSNGQMRHLIYVKSFLKRQKTTRLTLRQFAKRRSVQRCASSRSKARLSGQLASYSRREICSLSIDVAWRSPAMSNAVTRCRSLLRTPLRQPLRRFIIAKFAFGMDQLLRSLLRQNGPPGCTSRTHRLAADEAKHEDTRATIH